MAYVFNQMLLTKYCSLVCIFFPSVVAFIFLTQDWFSYPNEQIWRISPLKWGTSALVAQNSTDYTDSKIKLLYLQHTARSAPGQSALWIYFPASRVVPALPTRVQTVPLKSWNMYESGCDTVGSNHEMPAFQKRTNLELPCLPFLT